MEQNDLLNAWYKEVDNQLSSYLDSLENEIEYLLRNVIDKPIKGEITKGKLRWRGITSIVFGHEGFAIGIMQRGNIIRFVEHKDR
jgi:hypothetical protein